MEPVLFSWSGGKDSALALYDVLRSGNYEVAALLTTVAGQYGRVSHHGVREELLDMQAKALGLPLDKLRLPVMDGSPCTNSQFEELMGKTLSRYREQGIRRVVHGDLFLEDLRAYREQNLAKIGMQGLFPLWHRDTTRLVHEFTELGFEAYLCCVDGRLDGHAIYDPNRHAGQHPHGCGGGHANPISHADAHHDSARNVHAGRGRLHRGRHRARGRWTFELPE